MTIDNRDVDPDKVLAALGAEGALEVGDPSKPVTFIECFRLKEKLGRLTRDAMIIGILWNENMSLRIKLKEQGKA